MLAAPQVCHAEQSRCSPPGAESQPATATEAPLALCRHGGIQLRGFCVTPEQRTLRARIAAHVQWSKESDPTARTSKARKAFLDRFEREVDPDETMDPGERARRADHLRRAYFARLALASARSRAKKKGAGNVA
jgi:hypothetical protein